MYVIAVIHWTAIIHWTDFALTKTYSVKQYEDIKIATLISDKRKILLKNEMQLQKVVLLMKEIPKT